MNKILCWCSLFIILLSLVLISLYFGVAKGGAEDVSLVILPDVAASTPIHYNAKDKVSILRVTNFIDSALIEYNKRDSEDRVHCSYNSGAVGEKQVCDVPVYEFHPCTRTNLYNYEEGGPCIFLKLADILNWKPAPYNNTRDLPQDMSDDLKQHIGMMSNRPWANTVWVSCDGEDPADVENIGPIQYIPRRGFPSYYYPFTNKEGYLSPLVAVLFEKPKTGVLINVVCTAWAKNIDRSERRGQLHFELQVDKCS